MHCTLKVAAGAAALVALGGCLCTSPADTTTLRVVQVPAATLRAAYEPADYGGTFSADVRVDTGSECDVLDTSTTAEVSGVPLESQQDGTEACSCSGSRFLLSGAAIPGTPEGTFRVVDGTGEMTATAPQLFVERAVNVRGAPAELRAGARVYLDVVPAGETMDEVTASFATYSQTTGYETLFTFRSSDGTLGHDAGGWYFDVPSVSPASGQLKLLARALVATSTCAGAGRCEIAATAKGWLNTRVAAP